MKKDNLPLKKHAYNWFALSLASSGTLLNRNLNRIVFNEIKSFQKENLQRKTYLWQHIDIMPTRNWLQLVAYYLAILWLWPRETYINQFSTQPSSVVLRHSNKADTRWALLLSWQFHFSLSITSLIIKKE